jgi:hypothetical protein
MNVESQFFFNFKVQLTKFISMSCKEVTSIDNSILDKCTCKCGVKLKTNTHIVQLGEGVVGVLLMWGGGGGCMCTF